MSLAPLDRAHRRLPPGKVELEKIKAEHGVADEQADAARGGAAGERTLALGRFFGRPLPRRRLLQFFLYTTSFAVLTGGLALFLERRFGFDVKAVGYVFMVSGLMGALLQGVLGRMVKWLGEARLAAIGFLTMAAAYPLLGVIHTVPSLIGLVCFAGFGVTVVRPCLTTLLTKSVGRDEQGAALGTSQSLASISQMVGQPLAGFLIEQRQLPAYGIAAGVFALLGALLSFAPAPAADGVARST